MRSEGAEGSSASNDCDDPLVVIACAAESSACPAACREGAKEEEEDQAPKSGDLAITANSADSKVFIGRASDLDVLSFKSSEEVEISKVILERYGYSTASNVYSVWLENEEGVIITNTGSLDSKGQVKLTIKKDYRKVNGEMNATIVLESVKTNNTPVAGLVATQPGATFGFKVLDVTTTAANVDLDDYKPATYEAISFDGASITLTQRGIGKAKEYYFEAGQMYEVAKFKIESPDDSAIKVNGFTLYNDAPISGGVNRVDLNKYFNEAEVTIAGEKVSKLSVEANKSDELVVSFKEVEIAAKSRAEVLVKISLSDDLDVFGNSVRFNVTKINAVDSKVSSRVDTTLPTYPADATEYIFRGGKIKLASVKLASADAAQNSEDILVGEGTIEVPEALTKGAFKITASGKGAGAIKQLTVVVNGDDYDATPVLADFDGQGATAPAAWDDRAGYIAATHYVTYNGAIYLCKNTITAAGAAPAPANVWDPADWTLVSTKYDFSFAGVEIEKSGKVKFMVDTYDNSSWNGESVEFSSFKSFTRLDYEASNEDAKNNVSGSISFSKLTVQASKASMSNSLSKDVEFMNKATNREVVFDGTYTAKKGDVKLNEFSLTYAVPSAGTDPYDTDSNATTLNNKVTFYVYVDGDLVADEDAVFTDTTNNGTKDSYVAADTFDNVLVKDGESVSVKVEAEVEADNATLTKALPLGKYSLAIRGEDENGNLNSGKGKANTTALKVVEKGSVVVSEASKAKQTVIRKASDALLAQFTIKPSDGSSSVTLEEISFDIANVTPDSSDAKVTLKIDNVEEDEFRVTGSSSPYTLTYDMNREIKSEGATVVITLNDETPGLITISNLYVNGKKQTKSFSKLFADAAAWIKSQSAANGSNTYVLGVDKDSDVTVRDFTVYYSIAGAAQTPVSNGVEFVNDDKITVNGTDGQVSDIEGVQYSYTNGHTWDSTASKCYDVDGITVIGTLPTTFGANPANAEKNCEWSVVQIAKSSTAKTAHSLASAEVMPDFFKDADDNELKIIYKM